MMLVEMTLDHAQIVGVRAEEEVGDGAQPRDQPKQEVRTDVRGHPRNLPPRHAEVSRFPHDIRAERRASDIPDARDEVENDVEPDGAVDAWNDDEPLEQSFHRFDALPDRCGIRPHLRQLQALILRPVHLNRSPTVAPDR
jgi:hypothetical protein